MHRHILLALVLGTAAAASADEPLEITGTIDMPDTPSVGGLSQTMPVAYFINFTRPTRRVLMIGEERPKDILPMSGEPCVCDHPNLVCTITSHGATLGWRGNASDWPLSSGSYGSCSTEGAVFRASVRLQSSKVHTWWRGEDTLVVVGSGSRTKFTRTEAVWDNVVEAPDVVTDPKGVSCRFHTGTRDVTVAVAPGTMTGKHPCLSWDGGQVDIHLVPSER